LDRISWAYLQTLITNNVQIFSDIIKANKATALAILKYSLFHVPDVAQDEGQDLVQMNQFFIHLI
jgi:hypothetical protein